MPTYCNLLSLSFSLARSLSLFAASSHTLQVFSAVEIEFIVNFMRSINKIELVIKVENNMKSRDKQSKGHEKRAKLIEMATSIAYDTH